MNERISPAGFDLDMTDRLLATTRAVRKRLDLDRDVSDTTILECIDLAEQAPSGGNDASRRWLVIRDQELKDELGRLYAEVGAGFITARQRMAETHPKAKIVSSGAHLVENFAKVPALVLCAIWGIHDNSGRPGLFDSGIQAAWSFNLALRARGLGTVYATMLNAKKDEVAALLGIPAGITTLVCFPVAYTKAYDFSPAPRRPASEITYFDKWGFTRQQASTDGAAHVVDGPGVVAEIDIAAKPSDVWPIISDINVPVAFSDEFLGADWTTDAPRGVGSTFRGRNEVPGKVTWEVNCILTAWTENETFEWRITDIDDPGAIWRFDLAEQGTGSRLRMSMVIGQRNNGTAPAALKAALEDPAYEQKVLNGRRETLKANMQRTIEGIKVLAETTTR